MTRVSLQALITCLLFGSAAAGSIATITPSLSTTQLITSPLNSRDTSTTVGTQPETVKSSTAELAMPSVTNASPSLPSFTSTALTPMTASTGDNNILKSTISLETGSVAMSLSSSPSFPSSTFLTTPSEDSSITSSNITGQATKPTSITTSTTSTSTSTSITPMTTLILEPHKSKGLSSGRIAGIICVLILTAMVFGVVYHFKNRHTFYDHLQDRSDHGSFSNPMYDP